MKKKENTQCKASVGGQALMEGILMRGPESYAISLRLPDGSIDTTSKKVRPIKDKYKILGWPLIRGIVSFVESMTLGYKSLMESVEKTSLDDVVGQAAESRFEKWLNKHFGEKLTAIIGTIAAILGFGLAFLLFFWLPTFIFNLLKDNFGVDIIWKTVLEGGIRIVLFVSYMALTSLMKDIKRMYKYHGAEHKTIFCFENGLELTVENVRKQKRFHPRCGTSFLFVMIILSIVVSSVILFIFPGLAEKNLLWVAVKLMIVPVIMSLGFEFIRYAGRHDNIFVKILSAPGLWMQRITTKKPSDDIIEVAIQALKAVVLPAEKANEEAAEENIIEETPVSVQEPVTDSIDTL